MSDDYVLKYTNGYANRSKKIEESELKIDGDCKITNYDPRETNGEKKGRITINFFDGEQTIEAGKKGGVESTEKANFSNKKYSIFKDIAALDGEEGELSVADIKKIDKSYIEKWGLKDLRVDYRNGVVTLVWGKDDILRIDFQTWQENWFGLSEASKTKPTPVEDTKSEDVKQTKTKAEEKFDNTKKTSGTTKAEKTPVNLSDYYNNDNFEVIPATVHKVTGEDFDNKPYRYASIIGVSLDRFKEANPDKNMDWAQDVGSTYVIPERYVVKPGSVKSVEDVANIVGLSSSYINDIILGLEGKDKSLPFLAPYYDNVKSKNSGKKGVLTIGYGHTGRIPGKYIKGCKYPNKQYEMNSKNISKISITKEQALEILAQDLLTAKMDAIIYFGEDLLEAPQSLQDAIVDVVFNKGVDTGLRSSGPDAKSSPTNNLLENILNCNYVEATKNTLYATNLQGLKKRNVYRFIVSIRDLSARDRQKAMKDFQPYYEEVKKYFDGKGIEGELLERAWANALNGDCEGFFNS